MKSNDLSSVYSGSESLFLGTNDGQVRSLSQAFKVVQSFKAYESGAITHMKQVLGTALLVTIAEDLSNEPVLKVWSLDKIDKKTGAPKCLSSLGIHNGRKQFPVSAQVETQNWYDLTVIDLGFCCT